MHIKRFTIMGKRSVLSIVLGGLLLAIACKSPDGSGSEGASAQPKKSGPELWAQNCRRCHNFRSPSAFSDGEWDVVMQHMRIRAGLTAEESELIAQFLKASN